jgi:hypothetical protein
LLDVDRSCAMAATAGFLFVDAEVDIDMALEEDAQIEINEIRREEPLIGISKLSLFGLQ